MKNLTSDNFILFINTKFPVSKDNNF